MVQGGPESRAKDYSSRKYLLSVTGTVYLLALVLIFLSSGFSARLAGFLESSIRVKYLVFPAYLFIIGVAYYILDLPLSFYGSYLLEHKYSLSNQKIGDWSMDQLKAGGIGYCLGLILLAAFYYILKQLPGYWWLAVSCFWIFFSVVLAKLTPIIIIPLFFKYEKLSDEALRQRVLGLAKEMGVKILDVFQIDFSKKTLKANAAFVGVGSTRRVLLADTLKDKYTHDEITAILAHEFAHYRLKHIAKLIFMNSLITFFLFYIIFRTNLRALGFFGLDSLSSPAALPLVFLYFILFGLITRPLEAYISRRFERQADRMALKVTANKIAFISMMEKLAGQNLADRAPHPLVKLFFFDHPPVDERIGMAERFKV